MSVCQTNPLNTLVSKSGYRFGQPNQHQQSIAQQQSRPRNNALDHQFSQFTGASGPSFAHPQHQQLPMAAVVANATTAASTTSNTATASDHHVWIDQFANMQVHDKTEFPTDYKQMYSQYEARGASYSMGAPVMVSHSQMFPRHQQSLMVNQLESQAYASSSAKLDEQFAELERQVQDDEKEQQQDKDDDFHLKETSPLDEDQRQLKEAAQSIYTTLSDKSSTTSSKFSNSKFLGLMRNISDGVITLKKNPDEDKYTELYSPSTGETFGEEYFPVQDSVLGDPLDSIGDLSNMSSSEAAAKVYHNSV
ncbi:Pex21p [Kluyveromyces lactis]|uniref:Peroxisomal protein PEX21 n=1 Tax=Kluyveromyces lactis (strain ATCC 8585 / CBS 2359 / DSM 70799 / NBRC 1267 / NRRL Y-1140 / WM37) TaxID=284590 RepID=PEX21_KLULA|nr:uncharacterized protein KLLA0_E15467g [Kluyveromyces lactis]Q6CN41.1 RecName: Full=Peroxisomal protein PEX21; AltName: Full=Peroxin-21 [Kluyveromyces lactis NRRL Y-1140]CAG99735.1 KLLA0E15467p [Kluyveromyces lactis]|eukprot:XP_454648.1 uncharacterized protein KLLA0_E15467g [Kluyveromyces lactis]